jgi:hypothetical protein
MGKSMVQDLLPAPTSSIVDDACTSHSFGVKLEIRNFLLRDWIARLDCATGLRDWIA